MTFSVCNGPVGKLDAGKTPVAQRLEDVLEPDASTVQGWRSTR